MVGFTESRTAANILICRGGNNLADCLLNLPSQFQFYLILTLRLLYNSSLRQKLCLFTCFQGHFPSDVKGKLDTPSKVISKEAIEW
jgi:hypothetical protein